jgi:hypothetical protein
MSARTCVEKFPCAAIGFGVAGEEVRAENDDGFRPENGVGHVDESVAALVVVPPVEKDWTRDYALTQIKRHPKGVAKLARTESLTHKKMTYGIAGSNEPEPSH